MTSRTSTGLSGWGPPGSVVGARGASTVGSARRSGSDVGTAASSRVDSATARGRSCVGSASRPSGVVSGVGSATSLSVSTAARRTAGGSPPAPTASSVFSYESRSVTSSKDGTRSIAQASSSACTKSVADVKRASGDFSIARFSTPATERGSCGLTVLASGGASRTCRASRPARSAFAKGCCPVSSVKASTPIA